MRVDIPYNFKLRDYQVPAWDAFFKSGKKRGVLVAHRRAGKDKLAVNLVNGKALERKGNYIYLFPEQRQARRNIWNGIDKNGVRFLDHFPPHLISEPNNTEMLIRYINGSTFQLLGSDNYDSLMGSNPVGVIFSEFALHNPIVWELIKPILNENGGWAFFQGTPRGTNHLYKMYSYAKNNPDWYCDLLTIKDTKDEKGNSIITEKQLDEDREAGTEEEIIQQEYYCSFTAGNVGSYYGKYLEKSRKEGRVKVFDIDKRLPVFTFWDLGISDYMSIWFMQPYKKELRLIYYYEFNGEGLDHYFNILKEVEEKYKIKYRAHFAPHDIKVRELTSGKSRYEYALSKGVRFQIVPNISVQDGIQAVRANFKQLFFHEENCKQGIDCIMEYRKKYSEEHHCYSDTPLHNWASHGADALRYLVVGWQDYFSQAPKTEARKLNEII
jgi:hypothetical protein